IRFARGELIDLNHEQGVRFWVRADSARARLVFEFHHACCDGVSGLRFVAELLAVYAAKTGGPSADLPQLDPTLLEQRSIFGLERPTFREWLGHVRMTLAESWRLAVRTPAPLELPRTEAELKHAVTPFPGLQVYEFTSQEAETLRKAA